MSVTLLPSRIPAHGTAPATRHASAAPRAVPPRSDDARPSARDGFDRAPAVRDGAVIIDGRPTFLFGGDLHYFRVRDRELDPVATHAMWADSLDKMKAAGMNMVATYVPWDFHATAAGTFDFTGARDLRAFLELARQRDMKVVLKPGPLITGEWPRGPGSFGAVPSWFKEQHPGSLARTPGGLFRFPGLPWSGKDNAQPALLDPAYLDAVRGWYRRFSEEAAPYLGDTVVGVQIDNETNMYWSDRFGGPGHEPSSVAFYRDFLRQRYGTIGALNAAHGTSYASLADVEPPRRAPGAGARGEERRRAADWYDAGQAMVKEYLGRLRGMLADCGIDESRVMLSTNDSPFLLQAGRFPLANAHLVPDGRKNDVAPNAVDLYPKFSGPSRFPAHAPFQADFFVRLYDQRSDRDGTKQDFVWGAELQGGLFRLPLGLAPEVSPQATDQLLLRSIGRGLKGASLYVIRDGLNADNSVYDYQAALSLDGTPTARYEVLQRWGRFLETHGADLETAREVHSRVAILVDSAGAGRVGSRDNVQRLLADEAPALYGWLQNAGYNVDVIDASTVTDEDLARYKVVVTQTPDGGGTEALRGTQARAEAAGAMLVNFCSPVDGADAPPLRGWWNLDRSGRVDVDVGGARVRLPAYWYRRTAASVPDGATPLAWSGGSPIGWETREDGGRRVELLTNVYRNFNETAYYGMKDDELLALGRVARSIVGRSGERPLVEGLGHRELVWGRRSENRTYLFCANDNDGPRTLAPALTDPAAFGLDEARRYSLRDALNERELGFFTGKQLREGALRIPLAAFGSAVVVASPA